MSVIGRELEMELKDIERFLKVLWNEFGMALERIWKDFGRLVWEFGFWKDLVNISQKEFEGFWNDNGCRVLDVRLGISDFEGFGKVLARFRMWGCDGF